MAAEAEASSEARAKVIAAEGEYKALKEAAMVITQSPAALQLRYFLVIHRTTSLRFLPSSKLVFHITKVGRVLSCNRCLLAKLSFGFFFSFGTDSSDHLGGEEFQHHFPTAHRFTDSVYEINY